MTSRDTAAGLAIFGMFFITICAAVLNEWAAVLIFGAASLLLCAGVIADDRRKRDMEE